MTDAVRIDHPVPGHWLLRLVPNGPEVPAVIQFEADPRGAKVLLAYIVDRPVALNEVWLRRKRAITQDEYVFQMSVHDYARQWEPHSPLAHPTRKVDLNLMAPEF